MAKDSFKSSWQAFIKGDREAFSQVYLDYYKVLAPYAIKICKEKELAIDAI